MTIFWSVVTLFSIVALLVGLGFAILMFGRNIFNMGISTGLPTYELEDESDILVS